MILVLKGFVLYLRDIYLNFEFLLVYLLYYFQLDDRVVLVVGLIDCLFD